MPSRAVFLKRARGYLFTEMQTPDQDSHDRELYTEALNALLVAGIDFMLGGAFAVYHYTGWWRSTHDIDVYVTPGDLERTKLVLAEAGFRDLGEQAVGDHEWIYHAGKDEVIVDAIFRSANLSEYVSPDWFHRASPGEFLGLDVRFLPLEELLWVKIFVINRHRCDWPDLMRVIRAQCRNVNWDRLLEMLGDNFLLLEGLVAVFDWQHPGSTECIPDRIRDALDVLHEEYRRNPVNIEREHLLDPWLHQRADTYVVRRDE